MDIINMNQNKASKKKISLSPQRLPVRLGFFGASGSGKTNLLRNMIDRPNKFYYKAFSKIILFSPSFEYDETWKGFKVEMEIHDKFDPLLIKEIMDEQKYAEEKKHILIIFDDLVDQQSFVSNPILKTLFFRGRHLKISLFYLSQHYIKMIPELRTNLTGIILFAPGNKQQITHICKENSGMLQTKEFERLLLHATQKPFNFLFIDYKERNPKKRYRKNFDKYIEHI